MLYNIDLEEIDHNVYIIYNILSYEFRRSS